MVLPALVFCWLIEKCSTAADPALSALADLMVLAFFFLFCVGEYITSTPAAQAKT
jgi:TRAP-type C4-dicarboxylate transport system permease small subunit